MNALAIWFNLLCLFSLFVACEPKTKQIDKPTDEVYFNQTLLRDAILYLEKKFAIQIEMSNELKHTQDIWINYQTRGKGESLDVILDGIAAAIDRDHGLKILIERLTTDEGKDSFRLVL